MTHLKLFVLKILNMILSHLHKPEQHYWNQLKKIQTCVRTAPFDFN